MYTSIGLLLVIRNVMDFLKVFAIAMICWTSLKGWWFPWKLHKPDGSRNGLWTKWEIVVPFILSSWLGIWCFPNIQHIRQIDAFSSHALYNMFWWLLQVEYVDLELSNCIENYHFDAINWDLDLKLMLRDPLPRLLRLHMYLNIVYAIGQYPHIINGIEMNTGWC